MEFPGRIIIDKAWEQKANKIQRPKTKSSIKSIPLFSDVKDLLSEIKRTDDYIFSFIYKTSIDNRFRHHVMKYGLENLTLHSLRHYFATQCLEAGINDKVVSAWLGHSKTSVTKEIYQHIENDYENKQIQIITKFRGSKK